jgi:ABC-type Fe3+ transport system substrate-binding protein
MSRRIADTLSCGDKGALGPPISVVTHPGLSKTQVMPRGAVLIAGAPHQGAGKKLIDYLLSKETERKLAFSDAAQFPLHSGVATPQRPHSPLS